MNRLNEFFNFQMKTLMTTQKISIIKIAELFHHIILITSYYNDLKIVMKAAYDEHSNDRYHIKNASQEMHHLTYQIAKSRSIIKHFHECNLSFQSKNILQHRYEILKNDVKRFNHLIIEEE